jgi:hypothetical protein
VKAVAKLTRLGREQHALLARTVLWLVAVRVGLAILPLLRVRALAERASRGLPLAGLPVSEIRWAVMAVARRLPGTRCLPRALALQALLRQAGVASELRLGVAKNPRGSFVAHAWVNCDGEPFLPDEDLSAYTPLSPLPS